MLPESNRILDIRLPTCSNPGCMPTGIGLSTRPRPLSHPREGFRGRVRRLQRAHLTKSRRVASLLRLTVQLPQLLKRVQRSLQQETMFTGTDVTERGRRVGIPPKQIPWKVTAGTSAAERNQAQYCQTVSCPQRQNIRSVTREVMTTDVPKGASQTPTLAPPNGCSRSGGCS
jgi:hypothetical protein